MLWLAALRGGFGLPAVQLEYILARHLLNQQFAERPDQGINAVRRIPRRGPVDIRGKICHLVLELREGADVMDAALLVVQRRRAWRAGLKSGSEWRCGKSRRETSGGTLPGDIAGNADQRMAFGERVIPTDVEFDRPVRVSADRMSRDINFLTRNYALRRQEQIDI
jgi:hypothetical protein